MSVYLDASVLVALLTPDPLSQRAEAYLIANTPQVLVSNFAAAEFASAVARRVRMKELTPEIARMAFDDLDSFIAKVATHVEVDGSHVATAISFLRRLDLPLRAPDALNIAVAQDHGADLATLDAKMAASAKALGVPLASL